MQSLKKILIIGSLLSTLGACYIQDTRPRYAHRGCAYGWYWDGYRCHRNHHRW